MSKCHKCGRWKMIKRILDFLSKCLLGSHDMERVYDGWAGTLVFQCRICGAIKRSPIICSPSTTEQKKEV